MAFISVTRLRIRSIWFLPGFAAYAVRSLSQVRRAQGFTGGSLLNDRRFTFWTLTRWEGPEDMRGYMTTGAHKKAMPRLMQWCDEASVVHWEAAEDTLPTWEQAVRRMRAEGRASKVLHPSRHHADRSFAEPRTTAAAAIAPAQSR